MNKGTKKQRSPISVHALLLWGMAGVQAVRYARAFAVAEVGHTTLTGMADVDTFLAYGSLGAGMIMGLGMSLGLAFVASHLRRLKGRKETKWTTALFVVMLIVSPVVLAPMVKGSMAQWLAELLHFPTLQWIWAIGVVALPDVLIAAIGFMDRSAMVSVAPATTSDAQRPPATLKRRSAKKSASLNDVPAKVYRCECGETFVDRFKYSGHTRTCEKRKAIKAAKGAIPVDLSATPARVERGGER